MTIKCLLNIGTTISLLSIACGLSIFFFGILNIGYIEVLKGSYCFGGFMIAFGGALLTGVMILIYYISKDIVKSIEKDKTKAGDN